MDKPNSRLCFRAKLRAIETLVAPTATQVTRCIVKVEGRRYAVAKMVERSIQGKPVEVLRFRLRRMFDVQSSEPAIQLFVRREATVCALPQVAVRGNESGNNPLSGCIVGSRGGQAGRRRASADSGDGFIVPHNDVSSEGPFLPRDHG